MMTGDPARSLVIFVFAPAILVVCRSSAPPDVIERNGCALHIVDAEENARVPAKGEFVDVALQMMLANAVERADKTAPEKREGGDPALFVLTSPRVYSFALWFTDSCEAKASLT